MDTSSNPRKLTLSTLKLCSIRGTYAPPCECPSTLNIRTHLQEMMSDILLPDEKHALPNIDSVALTLKLVGAPIEPIFDAF